MSDRPMRAISLRNNVFEVIESVKKELTTEKKNVDKQAREATFSQAVWQVLKESGRVATK